jgi:hypothetical protein
MTGHLRKGLFTALAGPALAACLAVPAAQAQHEEPVMEYPGTHGGGCVDVLPGGTVGGGGGVVDDPFCPHLP